VRIRLFLALVAMFVIPIAIAAPLVYSLASDDGGSILVPTAAILVLAAVLGGFTVWLARRVLEPAERLDRVRVVLEDAYTRAHAESLRDSLTGLGNHRAFQEELERMWAGSARFLQRFALAIVDLDDFRRINDVEGHVGGDRVLVGVAATLTAGLRRTDRVFRIGGDEFAVLMPGADVDASYLSLRRVLAPPSRVDRGSIARATTSRARRGRSRPGSPATRAPPPIGRPSSARPTRPCSSGSGMGERASRCSTRIATPAPASGRARRWLLPSPRSPRPAP